MLKVTPGSVVSDGHVVLLPAGLTGQVTTDDGTTYNLNHAQQGVLEVDSHDHAKEVALVASMLAASDPAVTTVEQHDETQSRENLGLTKKED